ncbi:hypothetical protein [Desulfogranum japonicum]|uniref:hypothetical protein n=1 Tax=Desulfogranum japonicum TaxID=231447 RepID=UPI0003FB69AE|nr:hypothetical protein [Desulfogranum japonicum]
MQDTGEPGMSGITIYLDLNANEILDAGEPFSATDETGQYAIVAPSAVNYMIRVDTPTIPAGFFLTTSNLPLNVTPAAGEDYKNADFGYQQQKFPWWSLWPAVMQAVQENNEQ